jgi:hypothetical protein
MHSSSTGGARGQILVVEDDPEAALFVVHVLGNRSGFEVTHTGYLEKPLRVDRLIATATTLITQGRAGLQG